MVTAEDLRTELGYSDDEWTEDDEDRATDIIAGALRVVRSIVGGHRVDRAIALGDQDRIGAVAEATLVLAVARFSNPERALQRRAGADSSVSFADSSDAAGNRREAREILRGAFGSRAGMTTL